MKYSVIIPIYNAEKYLEECINSVINQKRKDVEVILVNDGSTDSSYNICNEFKNKYNNIIIINKENTGSMDSWIKGLEQSSGRYICFIDSDDKIAENYFEIIDKYVDKNYDVILFDFYKMYKNCVQVSKVNLIEYGELNQSKLKEIQNKYFYNYKNISMYRWDKVIKADIIKKSIEKIKCRIVYFEDHPISFLNLLNTQSLYYINEKLYYYRVRKTSVTHKYNKRVFDDNEKAEKEMLEIAKDNNYDDEQLYNIYLYFLYQYARASFKNNIFYNKRKVKFKDILKIKDIDKKIVILLYKFRLRIIYNIFIKIKNKKNNEEIEKFFD